MAVELHRKTAKLLYMALVLPIFKNSQYRRTFFCFKMETVDFFLQQKSAKYAKISLKQPRQN